VSTFRIFNHYIRVPFLILGLIEGGILYASVFISAYLRFAEEIKYFEPGLGRLEGHALVFAFVMVIGFLAMGLYQARMRDGLRGILLRLGFGYFFGMMMLAMTFYVLPQLYLGRGIILIAITISFITIFFQRLLFIKLKNDAFKRKVLVLGTGEKAQTISQLRRKSDRVGFNLFGYAHIRGTADKVEQENIISLNMPLKEFCIKNEVDEIVLAIDDRRKNFPIQELLDCKMSGIDVIDLASFFERETGKIKLDLIQPSWLIFSTGFHNKGFHHVFKRMFDIIVSLGLLFLAWPFMLLTIIGIKIEDGLNAPVFYKQIRIGEDGKPYYVLKFRSMSVDAEKDGKAKWAEKHDSRVTKIGAIIRKTRIDELPQIFNVIKGEMSFVGPRPERPEFVVKLSEKIPYYSERHRIKPGITGWAQISYPYGSSDRDAIEKLQYDLYYVKNYSLFLDFSILLQTAEVVLFGKGAR